MRDNFGNGLPGGNTLISGCGEGGIVRVCSRQSFTIPMVGAGGNIVLIPLAKYIDSAMWVSGHILTRIHAYPAGATGGSFFVGLWNTSYSEEDPATDFTADTAYTT